MAEPSVLDGASRVNRRALSAAATELYKSGAEPNTTAAPEHPTRAQVRQAQRALGYRGSKTVQKNPHRHQNRVRTGVVKVGRAVLVDEQLTKAQARVNHPLKSRLRRH